MGIFVLAMPPEIKNRYACDASSKSAALPLLLTSFLFGTLAGASHGGFLQLLVTRADYTTRIGEKIASIVETNGRDDRAIIERDVLVTQQHERVENESAQRKCALKQINAGGKSCNARACGGFLALNSFLLHARIFVELHEKNCTYLWRTVYVTIDSRQFREMTRH